MSQHLERHRSVRLHAIRGLVTHPGSLTSRACSETNRQGSPSQSVFAVGFFKNYWLLAGLGLAVLLQIGVVYAPVAQRLFGTVPLTWFDWVLIVAVSSSIWIADEIRKLLGLFSEPPAIH